MATTETTFVPERPGESRGISIQGTQLRVDSTSLLADLRREGEERYGRHFAQTIVGVSLDSGPGRDLAAGYVTIQFIWPETTRAGGERYYSRVPVPMGMSTLRSPEEVLRQSLYDRLAEAYQEYTRVTRRRVGIHQTATEAMQSMMRYREDEPGRLRREFLNAIRHQPDALHTIPAFRPDTTASESVRFERLGSHMESWRPAFVEDHPNPAVHDRVGFSQASSGQVSAGSTVFIKQGKLSDDLTIDAVLKSLAERLSITVELTFDGDNINCVPVLVMDLSNDEQLRVEGEHTCVDISELRERD